VPESDIFALGATIYYLLTGNLSLSKEYLSGQGPQKQDFSPDFPPIRQKNPEISPELEAVLQRACHLDVSNRYSSAAEFGRALGSLGRAAVPRRQIEEAVKPILSVDPERINFANVRVGSRATRSLTIRNIGTGRLTGKITTSHPWLKVTPETVDIERFKQDISVIVDARRLNKGVNIGGLIHINSSGGESNVDVSLSTDTLTRPTPAPVHEKPARKPLPVLTRRKIWLSAAAICVLALAVWGIITLVGISNPHLEIGKKVPDFTIPTLQGETVTLSDFRGKSVILYFWKSNCAPCVYEMPFLQAVFDKRPGEELAVLTISVGEPNETVRSFVEDKGFTFPVLLDANRKLSEKWGLVGVPTTFFIDAGGNLRGYKIGAFDNQGDLEEQLVSSLGISSPSPSTATKVIFEDDFSNPSSGWSTSSDNEVERRYESGGYRIVVKEADTLAWGGNKQIGSLGDFALEVDARCLSYNERSGVCGSYGIVFREQEGKNFYLFAISTGDLFTPGGYWIKKFVQGTSTALKAYAYSFKVNKSRPTLTNRLKVVCRGEEFTVYVNGYELDTVTDYSFPKGDVGLAAWAGSEDEGEADVLFDNLKIYVPD
jgi:peroxiredoxin